MLAVLALALLVGASGAVAADHLRVVEQRTLAPKLSANGATHLLTLHVYTFAGTSWRTDDISAALPRAAELLSQCGIAVERAELMVLETPRRFHDFLTPISRELVRDLAAPKPAVFFVQDTRNNPAFDAEAIGMANAGRRPELANTVWVAYGTRDLGHAIAHELVHVLSNSGAHSTAAENLMRDETSAANSKLSPEQCERMRSRGEANGLLARAK